jgi:predicted nucleotidyltransferase
MSSNPITWREVLDTSEKLPISDQLRLITELSLRVQRALVENEPVDLLTLDGVGKEVWDRVDTDAYLDQERESWQD